MFEIIVFCVILFAIAYWTTLFIMGRREDVLHGEFVEAEPELAGGPVAAQMDVSAAESVPAPAPVVITDPVQAASPVVAVEPVSVAATGLRPALATTPANNEKLQSLLASIKRELKNAAQI